VFGDEYQGRLHVVDLVRHRLIGSIRLVPDADGCAAAPLAWDAPRRLTVSLWCGDAHRTGRAELAVVDPLARRLVWRRPSGLLIAQPARLPRGGVALLTSPPLGPRRDGVAEELLGPARVVRIDAGGGFRQVVLTRISAGLSDSRTFNRAPGFAVDPQRRHAVLVSEGEGAAAVDLRTLRVTYHALPHAFDARPRSLAAPPRPHLGTSNPSRDLVREAYWLGGGVVAVAGWDNWSSHFRDQTLAAGLTLLDTRTWRVRMVNPRVRDIRVVSGTILAWNRRADGLWGYARDGSLKFHLFTGHQVAVGAIWSRRVRVLVDRRTRFVDARSGRIVR
jgi:hypothetical protein